MCEGLEVTFQPKKENSAPVIKFKVPVSRLWSQAILYLTIKELPYKYKQHYIIFNLHHLKSY